MEVMRRTTKTLYLTATMLLMANVLLAQNVWEPKSDMPTARKEIADAATVLNGKIYVLGGTNSSGVISDVFEMYDPATNSWTTLAPYPLSVWRASMEALNGKIYAMGGYESLNPFPFSPTDKAYSYDPGTNVWTTIQDMLVTRGSASSVVLDGNIHLMGGANNDALDSHHKYDPGTNSWSTVATLIQKRSGLTAAVLNGKIYATGGYFLSGGVVSLSSAEVYDPGTNSWSSISSMPFTKLGTSSGVIQNKMYVFGNENSTDVLEYNPSTDIWTELVAMPENVNFAGAATFNDLIYVIGGGEVNLNTDGIAAMNCFNPVVLGINDFDALASVILYPNPSTGIINLRLEQPAVSLRIINVLGEVIEASNLVAGQNNHSIELPYPDGLYFVEVQFDNGKRTSKKLILKR